MVIDKELLATLTRAFGLDGLPEEKKTAAMEKIGEILMKAILLHCVQELDEQQEKHLDELMAKNPENMELVFEYFRAVLPNFDEIVGYEVESFRQDTLGVMTQTQ